VEDALVVSNLTKRFGGVSAVDSVSFVLRRGRVHGLIGPNGAGKTTCFQVIAGALAGDGGDVLMHGTSIYGSNPAAISRLGLSRTFQNLRALPSETVFHNVYAAALSFSGCGLWAGVLRTGRARAVEGAARESAFTWLDRFGVASYAESRIGDLPLGLQRRVEIARCMVMDPSVILLDEPAAGMNAEETGSLCAALGEVAGSLSILLVEHDISFVRRLCEHITVLDQGRVIADADASEALSDPRVVEAYLGKEG